MVARIQDERGGRKPTGERNFLLRHGRACPGHPRPRSHRARTWMPGTSPGMTTIWIDLLLPRLFAAGLAVALQAVEVHADVGGFGRSVRQRNGAIEGRAGFVIAAELHQEGAAHAEEMKIVRQPCR